MVYVWEFEFYETGGFVSAEACGGLGEGTFGDDLADAVASAADWLKETVLDSLMGYCELPPMEFGHEPQHGGRIIAVAVDAELGDVPAMTASDAARELGVSTARIDQLIKAGLLESWKDGTKRMVSKSSVLARKERAPKAGRPKVPTAEQDNI